MRAGDRPTRHLKPSDVRPDRGPRRPRPPGPVSWRGGILLGLLLLGLLVAAIVLVLTG